MDTNKITTLAGNVNVTLHKCYLSEHNSNYASHPVNLSRAFGPTFFFCKSIKTISELGRITAP